MMSSIHNDGLAWEPSIACNWQWCEHWQRGVCQAQSRPTCCKLCSHSWGETSELESMQAKIHDLESALWLARGEADQLRRGEKHILGALLTVTDTETTRRILQRRVETLAAELEVDHADD